jgi:hypothetical protein
MPQLQVRTVSPAEESSAIETITLAFAADPMTRWCWPEPHARSHAEESALSEKDHVA